ncbi:MAG: 4Fe-4S binding protein [Polyangiaceae bacterium]|nr:4Fe-4S binding protein [Polyangiaceae bacterium]
MSETAEATKPKKIRGLVFVEVERCKGCGFCVEFCPSHALDLDVGFNKKGYHPPVLSRKEDCTGCDLCGLYCPDFAIFGKIVKKSA